MSSQTPTRVPQIRTFADDIKHERAAEEQGASTQTEVRQRVARPGEAPPRRGRVSKSAKRAVKTDEEKRQRPSRGHGGDALLPIPPAPDAPAQDTTSAESETEGKPASQPRSRRDDRGATQPELETKESAEATATATDTDETSEAIRADRRAAAARADIAAATKAFSGTAADETDDTDSDLTEPKKHSSAKRHTSKRTAADRSHPDEEDEEDADETTDSADDTQTVSDIPPFHRFSRDGHADAPEVRAVSSSAARAKKTSRTPQPHFDTDDNPDAGAATIITDTKHGRFKFFRSLKESIGNWFSSKTASKRPDPEYTVPDARKRKGVIQEATSSTARGISSDSREIRERIRQRERTAQPSRSHVGYEAAASDATETRPHPVWTPNVESQLPLLSEPDEVPHSEPELPRRTPHIQNVRVTPRTEEQRRSARSEATTATEADTAPATPAPEPAPQHTPRPQSTPSAEQAAVSGFAQPAPEPAPAPQPPQESLPTTTPAAISSSSPELDLEGFTLSAPPAPQPTPAATAPAPTPPAPTPATVPRPEPESPTPAPAAQQPQPTPTPAAAPTAPTPPRGPISKSAAAAVAPASAASAFENAAARPKQTPETPTPTPPAASQPTTPTAPSGQSERSGERSAFEAAAAAAETVPQQPAPEPVPPAPTPAEPAPAPESPTPEPTPAPEQMPTETPEPAPPAPAQPASVDPTAASLPQNDGSPAADYSRETPLPGPDIIDSVRRRDTNALTILIVAGIVLLVTLTIGGYALYSFLSGELQSNDLGNPADGQLRTTQVTAPLLLYESGAIVSDMSAIFSEHEDPLYEIVFTDPETDEPIPPRQLVRIFTLPLNADFAAAVTGLTIALRQETYPALVISVDNVEAAQGGLLGWESTMAFDVLDLLGQGINGSSPLARAPFTDGRVAGYDVRYVTDENDSIRLVYGFVDENTIVITTDEQTFATLAPLAE